MYICVCSTNIHHIEMAWLCTVIEERKSLWARGNTALCIHCILYKRKLLKTWQTRAINNNAVKHCMLEKEKNFASLELSDAICCLKSIAENFSLSSIISLGYRDGWSVTTTKWSNTVFEDSLQHLLFYSILFTSYYYYKTHRYIKIHRLYLNVS